jgi:uncharacterized membrane protein
METANPYAPPEAASVISSPTAYWNPQHWEPTELLNTALQLFKRDWAVLLGSVVVGYGAMMVASFIIGALSSFIPWQEVRALAVVLAQIVSFALSAAVQSGLTALYVASARQESPTLETFFAGMNRFLPLFGVQILLLVAVVSASLLLIVPGIIVFLGTCLATYYVVDSRLGPIEAISASWKATRNERGKIFVLFVLFLLLMIAGTLACFVGLIVAIPIISLAFALLYLRLSGRSPVLEATA